MVSQHRYQPGDNVLVDMGGAQIPGVVEDIEGETIAVRLAQPWADETGRRSDVARVHPNKVSPQVGSEGTPELPG